jgi:hypothetical protein
MNAIVTSYLTAWKFCSKQWRLLILLFVINLVTTYFILNPFGTWMESVLSKSLAAVTLSEGFDYNLIMDVLHEQGIGLKLILSNFFIVLLLLLIWSAFVSGGLVYGFKHKSDSIVDFWKGGALFFFKNFRLNIYVLLTYVLLIYVAYRFFAKDGLDVLTMESELFLINRFWLLFVLLIVIGFFISIWRDLARVGLAVEDVVWIKASNIGAAKKLLSPSFLILGLINLLFLVLIFLMYFSLKDLFGNMVWSVLLAQIFMLARLSYKIVRLTSFVHLDELKQKL